MAEHAHPTAVEAPTEAPPDPWPRVAELTAALQRAGRDLAIEAELPHLRLEAAERLRETTTPREPWPPPYPDPFPHVRGALPELGPDELTTAAVAGGLLHHGAVVVRGLLGPEDTARIAEEMDLTFASRVAAGDDGSDPAPEPWFVPFRPPQKTVGQRGKPHLIRAVDAPRVLADLLDTYHRLGVVDVVEEYLGEPPVFTANKSVLRYLSVGEIVPTDFHQDGRFMGAEVRAINVWVTLTDCGTTAPSLDLIPRRETAIAPTGNGDSGFDWTISAAEADAMAGDTPVVRLDLAAGDAVVFDHFLVHRSGWRAGMPDMRKAIECWFFAPSSVPWKYQPLRA